MKDQIFNESRKILEGKARLLREQGVGKKKNASKAIDSGEEDILWNYRKLGDSSSTSTFWSARLSGTHIYEDQKFCSVLRDINGCEYIEFLEDPTKTRQGGLRPNQRATNRKMSAVGGERCPARLFKMYLSKRPDGLLLEEKDVLLDYLKCIYQNGLMVCCWRRKMSC